MGMNSRRSIVLGLTLVAVSLLALPAIAAGPAPLDIKLQHGDAAEAQTRDQLLRLLKTYDVERWIFTRSLVIDSTPGVIPHSHPVLTLNTRHRKDDDLLLSTFVHENLHHFLTQHADQTDAAKRELRKIFPKVPVGYPDGADSEDSGYLHLIVNYLEYQADKELLGELRAFTVFQFWTVDHTAGSTAASSRTATRSGRWCGSTGCSPRSRKRPKSRRRGAESPGCEPEPRGGMAALPGEMAVPRGDRGLPVGEGPAPRRETPPGRGDAYPFEGERRTFEGEALPSREEASLDRASISPACGAFAPAACGAFAPACGAFARLAGQPFAAPLAEPLPRPLRAFSLRCGTFPQDLLAEDLADHLLDLRSREIEQDGQVHRRARDAGQGVGDHQQLGPVASASSPPTPPRAPAGSPRRPSSPRRGRGRWPTCRRSPGRRRRTARPREP